MLCRHVRCLLIVVFLGFLFKQKTAYEMRISDWSSDVCSSDLMMRLSARLASDRSGTSAVEMAMATPLLLVLLIGTFELGYYFLSEQDRRASCRERVCQYV